MACEQHEPDVTAAERESCEDLRRALDVAPSPDFVARVRVAVDRAPAPTDRWRSWWVVAASAAIVATACIAYIAMPRESHSRPEPSAIVAATPAIASAPPVEPARSSPGAVPPTQDVKPTARRTRVANVVSVELHPAPEPQVMVPPDQEAVLRRWVAVTRAQSIGPLPPTPGEASEAVSTPDLVIPPLYIEPLPTTSTGDGPSTGIPRGIPRSAR